MHVRVMIQQQAQNAGQTQTARTTTKRTTERPEQPERREQPERPEQAERPEVAPAPSSDLRTQLREQARAMREAARDIERDVQAEQGAANQVRIRNGVPVPPVPAAPAIPGGITIQTDGSPDVIPPQVVDLAYGLFVMIAVMVIGWPLSRAFGRRLERSGQTAALPAAMGEQLTRIEQAVEAMAVEVERISEGQRYLTKLQASAGGEPAALPGESR